VAVDSGKQYVEKYGSCPDSKEFVDYLNSYLPGMEDRIKKEEAAAVTKGLYTRFDTGYKAKNWDEVYAAGKDVLAKEPDNLDLILTLGSIGYDESIKNNYKYNDDTLRYAKLAIQKINEGKTSQKYGLFDYQYDNKDNALGWMNLNIGFITFYGKKDQKGALPYLYAAAQANGETKARPDAFEPIGIYYFGEVQRLSEELKTLSNELNAATSEEVKAQKDAEIKAKTPIFLGTTERALDAYARAYNIAKKDPKMKTIADRAYKNLQTLYNARFEKTDGLDTYIATVVAKPMPDPTSAVTPVVEAETTTNKTGTVAAPVVEKPSATATAATSAKPAAAVPAKPAATADSTAAKSPVKKPVVKKKGTR
jgi:hypothetical protein